MDLDKMEKLLLFDGTSEDRCDRCCWPLYDSLEKGCTVDNCSLRGGTTKDYRPPKEQEHRKAIRTLIAEVRRLEDGWAKQVSLTVMAERERDEAREVLERFLAYKPFEQKFNHCGAMNATQLAERDKYVEIRDMAIEALTGGSEK